MAEGKVNDAIALMEKAYTLLRRSEIRNTCISNDLLKESIRQIKTAPQ